MDPTEHTVVQCNKTQQPSYKSSPTGVFSHLYNFSSFIYNVLGTSACQNLFPEGRKFLIESEFLDTIFAKYIILKKIMCNTPTTTQT